MLKDCLIALAFVVEALFGLFLVRLYWEEHGADICDWFRNLTPKRRRQLRAESEQRRQRSEELLLGFRKRR